MGVSIRAYARHRGVADSLCNWNLYLESTASGLIAVHIDLSNP